MKTALQKLEENSKNFNEIAKKRAADYILTEFELSQLEDPYYNELYNSINNLFHNRGFLFRTDPEKYSNPQKLFNENLNDFPGEWKTMKEFFSELKK